VEEGPPKHKGAAAITTEKCHSQMTEWIRQQANPMSIYITLIYELEFQVLHDRIMHASLSPSFSLALLSPLDSNFPQALSIKVSHHHPHST